MKILFKKNHKKITYFTIFFIVYLKYVFFVGLSPGDDYFHINFAKENPKILDNIIQNLIISPARPISAIMLGFTHPIIGDKAIFYNTISLILWISCALILKKTFKTLVNKNFSEIFFIIFSFPYLCFSIFYGNLLWATYILFLIFWSLSFFFQVKYYQRSLLKDRFLYYFFLIVSFFTFELVIPLLLINIFLPFVFGKSKKNIFYNFLNILAFSFIFLIYKIFLIPTLYESPIYGLSNLDLKSFLQGIYFFYTISIENLILLIQSIKFIFSFKSLVLLILTTYLFYNYKFKKSFQKKSILIIFILSLLSSFIVFLISGYPAVTYGHYSKMLVPAFLCFSVIVSYSFIYFELNKWLLIIFVYFVINTTSIQIDNYSEATKIKKKLIDKLILNIEINDINENDTILVNSPLFVPNNFNNEEIVFTTWDLKFRTFNLLEKNFNFWLISDRLINNVSYYPLHNFMNSKFMRSDSDNFQLFYFEYQTTSNSFEKFTNKTEFLNKLNELKKNKVNSDGYIFREKIRLWMKNFIYNFI